MAYILNEILTWRGEVQTYWENEIDNSTYNNKAELKTDITSYLDSLEDSYDSYISGASLSDLKDTLNPLFSYTTLKYKMILPTSAPSVPELITNGDTRNFYENWTYQLPIDYSIIFDIVDSTSAGDGKIELDTGYTTTQDKLSTANNEDNVELENFRNNFPNAVQDQMIYQAYKQPDTDIKDFDTRCYILQDMYLEDVLNKFSFTINGVNQNVDSCS